MGQGSHNPPAQLSEHTSSERVESWKEIAAHFKRGVRTIQRWEKEEGLPVHRHTHDKRATVYAYKAELDDWWRNGQGRLEAKEAEEAAVAKKHRFRWVVTGVVAAGLAVVGVGWWMNRTPALPFEERDWVLIAQFENRTGEEVFDGTVEFALEQELSNSRFVNVVSRPRIDDTLLLMRRPLDTRLTPAVAREVALRDGGIRAVISGRVEKLDSTYLLTASLVRPARGTTVASFSEEAAGQEQIIPALRRLSHQLRESLGEELAEIRKSEQALEKVTTPSLHALRLFSEGSQLKERGQFQQAEEFLRQAIAEDPAFASAHLWLAYALVNQGRPQEEVLGHARKAVELIDTVSERERYFIRGGYHMLAGEYKEAVAPLEALVRLHPDHYFGLGNLAAAYTRLGRPQSAIAYHLRAAVLRPRGFSHNAGAALAAYRLNEISRGKVYLERARQLAAAERREGRPVSYMIARLEMLPVYADLLRDEVEGARAMAAALEPRLSAVDAGEREAFREQLGGFYLTLGRLAEAEEILRQISNGNERQLWLAEIALARGNMRAVREHLQPPPPWPAFAALLARGGATSQAQALIPAVDKDLRRLRPPEKGQGMAKIVKGEINLAKGQTANATVSLREGVRLLAPYSHNYFFFLGSESLARALEEQGDLAAALRTAEEVAGKRALVDSFTGTIWVRVQWQRARLLRKLGRGEEAVRVEAELSTLLAHADADHVIARELRKTQRAELTPAP